MTSASVSEDGPIIGVVRKILCAILILGMLGTMTELLLLQHTEDARQWVPLVLLAVALGVFTWHGISRGWLNTQLIRWLMVAFVAAGLAGVYFHYQGGAEFKLESNPGLRGWPLFWAAIRAKTPPLLAPGAMVQLGLMGLAYTHKHPALGRKD